MNYCSDTRRSCPSGVRPGVSAEVALFERRSMVREHGLDVMKACLAGPRSPVYTVKFDLLWVSWGVLAIVTVGIFGRLLRETRGPGQRIGGRLSQSRVGSQKFFLSFFHFAKKVSVSRHLEGPPGTMSGGRGVSKAHRMNEKE
jgi:hypothetical protein